MKANGSGGAVGTDGAWATTGAGGGAGGATYQDCAENSAAAVVSLTMRSDMRNEALSIGDLRVDGAARGACVLGPAAVPRAGSMVWEVSGIMTIQPAQPSATPMSALVRSVTLPNTMHLADK